MARRLACARVSRGAPMSKMISTPTCQHCGAEAKLVSGLAVYPHRPDLCHKKFWLCGCGAFVGCHPGTSRPLGAPSNAALRRAKTAAHYNLDPLWKTGRM